MTPTDKFNPVRVNPDEPGYEMLTRDWERNGKPRVFSSMGISWRQIRDTMGICFVPEARSMSAQEMYDSTSLGGNSR